MAEIIGKLDAIVKHQPRRLPSIGSPAVLAQTGRPDARQTKVSRLATNHDNRQTGDDRETPVTCMQQALWFFLCRSAGWC